MKFLNIFSKNKIVDKKILILADHREKNALVPSELIKRGFEIEFKQLPVGDYIVNDIAIERKTIADLKTSVINKRIMRQLSEIKQFKKQILIIEGFTEENYRSGILHENALRGFLLSVAINYQVPIIYTVNAEDSAKYIALLAKKSANKDVALRASKQNLSESERAIFILEGFPGIGPSTAKKLLKEFRTLKSIIDAPVDKLTSLIGKKAESIIQLRDLVYRDP